MITPDVNEYLRTKVMTASSAELRLMLIDGAIRFAEQAREGLLANDHEKIYQGSTQCRAILTELITSLQPEVAPLLCERLAALYTFMYNEMVSAVSHRDPGGVEKVVELLTYERETWVLAIERLAAQGAQNEEAGQCPADFAVDPTDEAGDTLAGGNLNLSG